MKIFILRTPQSVRPDSQNIKYPVHNADYGVEQDFLAYLHHNKHITTDVASEADWHYLPVYWTRWHLNHDYGTTGMLELQAEVDRSILNDVKTFTICQYDDGPLAEIGSAVRFLSSRKSLAGIDIPLLSTSHKKLFFTPRKRHLAAFVGRLDTHPLRQEMADALRDCTDAFIYDGNKGADFFVKALMESYVALCPRGYGGSSFRFFEAMQMGVVPLLLGDLDTRPFKKLVPWERFSFYVSSAAEIRDILDGRSVSDFQDMASSALQAFRDSICFGKWCKYVIKELEDLS